MRACLDDLVIALYVTIDDLLGPDSRAGHPGRKPRLSDAELVCLAVAQVLLGCHGEHRWLRFCYGRLGICFRICPTSPATTSGWRRPLAAGGGLAQLADRTPSTEDRLRLLDATPIPCAASRQTVKRSALRGVTRVGVPATRAGTGASSCMSSPP